MDKIYIKDERLHSGMDKYLKPEYVYIQVENNDSYNIGDYIYKNDINFCSPVSGYVVGYDYKFVNSTTKSRVIVIENDYKEKHKINKYVFNKEKLFDTLIANNLLDSYDEYDIKYLIINAIDFEPFVFSKRLYIEKDTSEILMIIDNIMDKMNIDKAVLAVVNDSKYDNLFNYIGTYPNIKIVKVNNYYPVSNNKTLLKELFGISYHKSSLEKKIWILDLLSLMDVNSIIKNNRISNEKIITIGGKGITNTVIVVKIGTSLKEIIKYLGGYRMNDISITIGGPLSGRQISSDDIVITRDIAAIFITKEQTIKEKECISCGKCNSVCPIHLVPVFIMKNINNISNLKKLGTEKCTECGLCSYICPSYINLKDYIIKAKEMIADE